MLLTFLKFEAEADVKVSFPELKARLRSKSSLICQGVIDNLPHTKNFTAINFANDREFEQKLACKRSPLIHTDGKLCPQLLFGIFSNK